MTDECVRKKTEIDDDSCKKFVLSYEAYFSKCTLSVDAKRFFFQIWPWTTCGFSMMEPWNTNSTPNQISRSSFHSEVAIAISRSNSIRFFFCTRLHEGTNQLRCQSQKKTSDVQCWNRSAFNTSVEGIWPATLVSMKYNFFFNILCFIEANPNNKTIFLNLPPLVPPLRK